MHLSDTCFRPTCQHGHCAHAHSSLAADVYQFADTLSPIWSGPIHPEIEDHIPEVSLHHHCFVLFVYIGFRLELEYAHFWLCL